VVRVEVRRQLYFGALPRPKAVWSCAKILYK
jgi:hypothetical protein